MAIFNEILVGRWNRGLQRMFAIKGHPPVRQLAGEISPQFAVSKDGAREFRFNFGERTWGVFNTVAAVVASSGFAFLRNPPGSGMLLVVERIIWFPSAAAQSLQLVTNISNTPILGTQGSALDYRQVGAPAGTVNVSTAGVITSQAILGQFARANADSVELITKDEEFVIISPGGTLAQSNNIGVILTQQNAVLNVSFWWRERPLEESELS